LRAFSAICTHLDCIVQYRSDLKHIWCVCHNGHYNLRGINIAGPPPRPLAPYKENVRGDKIFVSRET
ncbi:MAG: ubiquinol-cytochrome c reductase iron-sulfur subunit, partial [Calditrichia bacterium]